MSNIVDNSSVNGDDNDNKLTRGVGLLEQHLGSVSI